MRGSLRLRLKENPLFGVIYHTLFEYPTPVNLNYGWNFGVMALSVLVYIASDYHRDFLGNVLYS